MAHFLNLPQLVTSIILKSLDFPTIKILRLVCSTTNGWVEVDWDFWRKTTFSRIEFPWFRDENYAALASLQDHYQNPIQSLRFRSYSQTHFYSHTIFSRLSKFINTQFTNTSDLPFSRFPGSNLTCDPVYPTAEQDRSRRFPGRPLHYIVEFTFDFQPGAKYHLNYGLIQRMLRSHGIRKRARLDEIREFTLTIQKPIQKPAEPTKGRVLERVMIRIKCQSSLDRRGENGWGAPEEIFRDWPRSSLARNSREEKQLYREYYMPRIM